MGVREVVGKTKARTDDTTRQTEAGIVAGINLQCDLSGFLFGLRNDWWHVSLIERNEGRRRHLEIEAGRDSAISQLRIIRTHTSSMPRFCL